MPAPADDAVTEEKSVAQGSAKPVILIFKEVLVVSERLLIGTCPFRCRPFWYIKLYVLKKFKEVLVVNECGKW